MAQAPPDFSTGARRVDTPDLLLAFAVACWAGNLVVGRAVRDLIGPVELTFARWLLALLIVLPFAGAGLWRHRATLRAHLPLLFAFGLLGVALFNTTLYLGLARTTTVNAALLMGLMPLAIALADRLLFRARLGAKQATGIALSVVGAAWTVLGGDPGNLLALRLNAGDLWVLVAVISWALYSVLLRRRPAGVPPQVLFAAICLAGVLLLAPVFLLTTDESGADWLGSGRVWLAVVYVALFASVLATIAWNQGVAALGAVRGGIFIQLMPVLAALLAVIFLGERIAAYHLVSAVLVLGGLLLARGRVAEARAAR